MRWSRFVGLVLVALAACACEPAPQAQPLAPTATVTSQPSPLATTAPAPTSTATPSGPIEPPALVVSPPSAEETARMAKSANAFGLDLYAELRDRTGNLALSPLSISSALAMTWAGARGETASEMKRVLRFEGTQEDVAPAFGRLAGSLQDRARPVTLRIANRLYGEASYAFDPAFLELTSSAYGAPLERVDFKGKPEAARSLINSWVEARTDQRIQFLVPPNGVDRDTRLTLVNAMYFLGAWESPFNKEATTNEDFFLMKGQPKKVPTMHRVQRHRFAEKHGVKALELPYKGGSTSMLVLLPTAVDGLAAFERTFSTKKLEEISSALSSKRVEVSLPRFEIKPADAVSLPPILRSLGMIRALDPRKADFTGIASPASGEEGLYIARAFHKAFVKVDEKGTESAAATAMVMGTKNGAPPEQTVELKADHPFLFLVRDSESGLILFMGRVADPTP